MIWYCLSKYCCNQPQEVTTDRATPNELDLSILFSGVFQRYKTRAATLLTVATGRVPPVKGSAAHFLWYGYKNFKLGN